MDGDTSPVEQPQGWQPHPGLHIVATPIGNLADMTHRGLATLCAADIIACEDTRHSVRLLKHYDVPHKPLVSLNEHNEARRIPEIVSQIQQGKLVALVSDAGMPTISDPGQRLARAVIDAGCHLEVAPGPSAVLTALAASGLLTCPFYFGGFLPHKKGQREKEVLAAALREHTSIYFESPYRLTDTLQMLATATGEFEVVVARELTKRHETFHRGKATELHQHFVAHPPKGEICLLIGPRVPAKWIEQPSGDSRQRYAE